MLRSPCLGQCDRAPAALFQMAGEHAADATLTNGCTLLGRVKDDEVKDLRRKIARLGGDTAVVAFGHEDIIADVYRCPAARMPPSAPPPPAGAPPPPPPPPR